MLKLWCVGGGTEAVRLRVGFPGPLDPLDAAGWSSCGPKQCDIANLGASEFNLGVYCGGGTVSDDMVQVAVFVTVVS